LTACVWSHWPRWQSPAASTPQPGVVDQRVHWAELGTGRLHQAGERYPAGQAGDNRDRLAAARRNPSPPPHLRSTSREQAANRSGTGTPAINRSGAPSSAHPAPWPPSATRHPLDISRCGPATGSLYRSWNRPRTGREQALQPRSPLHPLPVYPVQKRTPRAANIPGTLGFGPHPRPLSQQLGEGRPNRAGGRLPLAQLLGEGAGG